MKPVFHFLKKRALLIVFLFIYFLFSILSYKDFGISFDESDVYLRGKLFYTRIRSNDPIYKKDFAIPQVNDFMPYYNHTYAAFLYAINDNESYEFYHLLNLLTASVGFIVIYEVLYLTYKSQFKAIIGPLLLVFTPRFFGEIPINPKDMPFAIAYIACLYAIFVTQKIRSTWRVLILGVFFGIAQSQRIIGYSLYPIYFIFCMYVTYSHKEEEYIKAIFSYLPEFILVFLIGFLVHMVSVPYLGIDPINNFISLLQINKSFPWAGTTLFLGKQVLATSLPWHYLFTWFLSSTPPLVLFSILAYPFTTIRLTSKLTVLLLITVIINFLLLFILKPVLYDGVRHVIYLIPVFVLIASISINNMLTKGSYVLKFIVILLVGFQLFTVLIYYLQTHPYEYTYFNILSGGLTKNSNQFETEYWGTSTKELFQFIENNPNIFKDKSVGVYGNLAAATYYKQSQNLSINVYGYKKSDKYDYVMCWYRWNGCEGIEGVPEFKVVKNGVTFNTLLKQNNESKK